MIVVLHLDICSKYGWIRMHVVVKSRGELLHSKNPLCLLGLKAYSICESRDIISGSPVQHQRQHTCGIGVQVQSGVKAEEEEEDQVMFLPLLKGGHFQKLLLLLLLHLLKLSVISGHLEAGSQRS